MNASSALRTAIRQPLRLIPDQAELPILAGPLRGARWIAGSHVHSCWLGTYERPKPARFAAELRPGDVVYDVGANVGYYTLIASRQVGALGTVVACEPVPRNLDYLRAHLHRNGCTNTAVVAAAVSDAVGTESFAVDEHPAMGHLASVGELVVDTLTIDALADGHPPPDVIKMDIEGAEYLALSGASRTLAEFRPRIFLATHGAGVQERCVQLLETAGYGFEWLGRGDDRGEIFAVPSDAKRGS